MGYIFMVDKSIAISSLLMRITARKKFDAVSEVVDTSPAFADFPDLEKFKRTVWRRERMENTGIGHGVAIAHGKIHHLDRIRVGLGVSVEGIDYGAPDGQPVHLLFVIASSPNLQMEYLGALAQLLRTVREESVRRDLVSYVRQCARLPEHADADSIPLSCSGFLSLMERLFTDVLTGPHAAPVQ